MASLIILSSDSALQQPELKRLSAEFERQVLQKWASTRIERRQLSARCRDTIDADYLALLLDETDLHLDLSAWAAKLPSVPSVVLLAGKAALIPHLRAKLAQYGLSQLQFITLEPRTEGYRNALAQLEAIMSC